MDYVGKRHGIPVVSIPSRLEHRSICSLGISDLPGMTFPSLPSLLVQAVGQACVQA
ncbi:MAG: hypothetical protein AVDCRST_MAG93-912 [uncultured Chloroflexia bacterium]|uniref:Uncharacterized protein n=1 Tax=uncultured Chloroflexia bacterium TaxID=1672391 RepID=A0A6J4HS67_9CHLR|nr:MAG: hypothetical protein AVDCRST_MAG93-912 [uncultured Chloroflexia bacterium]